MLASYSKENGLEFIWNSLSRVKDIAPEVQSQISKLTNKVILDFNQTAITDESVVKFMESMQKSGTVYTNTENTMSGYQAYLQSTSKSLDLANLRTKALTVSMKVLSTVGWMAVFAAASWAIGKGIEIIGDYIHRVEKAKEVMAESASAYESTKQELEDINTKLETQSARINELLAKDKLTYAEKGELEELQNITAELEYQKVLKEKTREAEATKLASDAADAYSKEYGAGFKEESIQHYYTMGTDGTQTLTDLGMEDKNIAAQIAKYRILGELTEETKEKDSEWFAEYNQQMKDTEIILWENVGVLEKYKKTLESVPQDELTSGQKADLEEIRSAIKSIWNEVDPNEWNSIQIVDIFNTNGIEKTKDELIEMVKSGELTQEELKKYPNLFQAIDEADFLGEAISNTQAFYDDLCASADELDKLSEPKSLKDTISNLDAMSEKWKSVNALYEEFSENGVNKFSNDKLADIAESFHDIAGVDIDSFLTTLSDSASTADDVQKAFNRLSSEYIFSSNCLKGLTDATAEQTVRELEAQGIVNASTIVYDYLAASKAWAAAKGYDLADASTTDIVAFLNEKSVSDETRVAIANYALQKELSNGITLQTDGDIKNIRSLISACGGGIEALNAYNRARQGMIELLVSSPMFSAIPNLDNLSASDLQGGLQLKQHKWEKDNAEKIQKQKDELDNLQKEAEDDIKNAILKASHSGNASNTPNTKSDDSTSDFDVAPKEEPEKEFDWIERRNEILKKEHDIFQETADDETASYRTRIDAIGELIESDKKRLAFAQKSASQYSEAWEKAKENLSQEQIDYIETGGDNVGKYKGQDAENVQAALDAHDNMVKYQEELSDLSKEQNEHLSEQIKLREKIIKAQQDSVKSEMDILQARMDYTEARGGILTAGMYEEQIVLSKELSRSYDDQIDNLHEQLEQVDAGSSEYYSLRAQINDCENAIIECKIQQSEWNEQIMRLPIERLQKYLNALANIKQDLQNFLDEQSVMGINPTAGQLQQLFDISQEEISSLLKQQSELKNLLSEYKYGSEKFNDVSQEIQDIDDGISSLIQNQKDLNAQMLQIPVDRFDKLNDTLGAALSTIDDVIGEYDTALSAVTSTIDKQIDSVNELKDAIDGKKEAIEEEKKAAEESYQDRIDPIQEELDLLNEQNEARKIQLSLEQAKYNLDKARNQRTNKVIRNGEIVYESDEDDIKNAANQLADAELEKIKYDSDKAIKALEEARDKELEAFDEKLAAYDKELEGLDSEIDRLDEIKDRWSSIKDEIQLAADTAKADGLFGSGWQEKLLSGNDSGMFAGFKELYENILSQKSQYEDQTASNERIVDMMNQFITKYQDGSITYEQAMAGIKELSAQMKDGYSALEHLNNLMGVNGGTDLSSLLESMQDRADDAVGQLSDYLNLVEQNSTALEQYTKTWDEMKQNITNQIEALKKAAEALEHIANNGSDRIPHGSSGGSSGGSNGPFGEPGYVNSGPGVAYDKIEKQHGSVASGYVGAVSDRQKVLDAFKQLTTGDLKPNEVPIIAQTDELVLTTGQQNALLDNLHNAVNMSQVIPIPSFTRSSGSGAGVTVTFGDITLPNVKDGDGFAKAIEQTFEPTLKQYFSKVFRD